VWENIGEYRENSIDTQRGDEVTELLNWVVVRKGDIVRRKERWGKLKRSAYTAFLYEAKRLLFKII
jgi:hypothetical protein